jgi:hypothetical protein
VLTSQSLTGTDDIETSTALLDSCDWNLDVSEEILNLYYSCSRGPCAPVSRLQLAAQRFFQESDTRETPAPTPDASMRRRKPARPQNDSPLNDYPSEAHVIQSPLSAR